MSTDRAAAERALAERKQEAKRVGQIDNSRLYAGSPMYFYCQHCGLESDCLPEGYTSRPNRICDPCKEMKDQGWL